MSGGWKKSKKSINVEGRNVRGGWIFFSKSISVTPRLLERWEYTFPLMTWWISGTLSVVVLAITYFAEVISTIFSKKFDHFFLHCTVGFAAKSTIGEQSFSMPSFYHWASKWQVLSIVNGSKLLLLIGKTKTQRQLPTYHQKIMSALNIVKRTEQKVSL